jgi:hypothetical protein
MTIQAFLVRRENRNDHQATSPSLPAVVLLPRGAAARPAACWHDAELRQAQRHADPILTLYVEPLFPRCQEPTRVALGGGQASARAQQIGKMDEPVGLDLVWTGPRKARLGPLPREWAKTEVELSFPGVRSVTGELLKVAPVTVKVQ